MLSLLYGPTLTSIHDEGKTTGLTIPIFVGKMMSLLLNMLGSFSIAFLPKDKCLLISWLQSSSVVILEPKKIKCATVSTFLPIYLPWSNGTGHQNLSFLDVEFEANFFTISFHHHQDSLVPLCFLPLDWYHLHFWSCWYFSRKSLFQLVIHPAWHFTWCTLHMR